MGRLRRLLRMDADPDSSFNFHLGTIVALVVAGLGLLMSVVGHYKLDDPNRSWLWAPMPIWLFKAVAATIVIGGFALVCIGAVVRTWQGREDDEYDDEVAEYLDEPEPAPTPAPAQGPPPTQPIPTLPFAIDMPQVRKNSG
jgi:hypothetical protein